MFASEAGSGWSIALDLPGRERLVARPDSELSGEPSAAFEERLALIQTLRGD